MTPFKFANVPPPMARFTVNFESPVSCVAFGNKEHGDDLACLLANGDVAVLKSRQIQQPIRAHELIGGFK